VLILQAAVLSCWYILCLRNCINGRITEVDLAQLSAKLADNCLTLHLRHPEHPGAMTPALNLHRCTCMVMMKQMSQMSNELMKMLCCTVQNDLLESDWNRLHSVIERIAANVQATRHKVCSHSNSSRSNNEQNSLTEVKCNLLSYCNERHVQDHTIHLSC